MTSITLHHKLVAASLPAAAALWTAGGLIDPAVDESTPATYMAGIAETAAADRYQISALVLHFSFLLFLPAVIGLWGLSRPGALRTVGLVLAGMGAATLPGLVVTDYYDIALAQSLPAAQAGEVAERAQELTGAGLLAMPAVAGMILGLVLLFVTAVRARQLPAWAPLVLVAALAMPFAVNSMPMFAAAGAVMLVLFAVLAGRLLGVGRAPQMGPSAAAA